MSDGIVERLRAWVEWDEGKRSTTPIKNPFTDSWNKVSLEAADEIERLRVLIAGIQTAIFNEGRNPEYHQQVMRRHRSEWPALWSTIDKLMIEAKEARGE